MALAEQATKEATSAIPSRRIKNLPGPRAWPVVGNALQIDRHRLHEQLEAWAKEFGEAYTFSIFSRRFVVLANSEAVAAVLRNRPDGFRRSTRLEKVSVKTNSWTCICRRCTRP